MSDETDLHVKKGRKQVVVDPAKVDRTPPHSTEAEQGVLGCILLDPNASMPACVAAFKGATDRFYDLRHRTIYEKMFMLWDGDIGLDALTLQEALRDSNQLDAVGGLPYIMSLPDAVPSAANLEHYLVIVNEKFFLRSVIATCIQTVGRVYEHQGQIDELLDDVQQKMTALTHARYTVKATHIRPYVQEAIADIDAMTKGGQAFDGIPTGFIDLDKLTLGLHNGEMIVLAARPSVGKSALAQNIVEHVAIKKGIPCGIFSLEMRSKSLVNRMIASQARIDFRTLRDGFFAERDSPKILSAGSRLSEAPIFIDDTAGQGVLEVRAKARQMKDEHGIRLFVVDYMQLLHGAQQRRSRAEEVSDVSRNIQAMARELDIPVIAISQLNRDIEREKSRPPRLSDLRESGSIEQDGDTIILLWPRKGEDDDTYTGIPEAIPVSAFVAKQRNGPTGVVDLTFLKTYTRFENAAKVSSEEPNEARRSH